MRVEFFVDKDGMLNPNAVKPGVYRVSVLNAKDRAKRFVLYIGESFCMVKRCGEHLYNVNKDPAYFGLTEEQLNDDRLVLSFEVQEVVEPIWNDRKERDVILKEHEIRAIIAENPVSQCGTSDCVRKRAKEYVTAALNELLE